MTTSSNRTDQGQQSCVEVRADAKILLIDDDPVFGMVTTKRLEGASYDVEHITDAQSGYALLARHKFDLVIVDLSMPELDGLDFIGSLRSAESTKEMPVIVVTGSVANGDLRSAMDLDVSWFVNKPINWELFERQVEQSIEDSLCTPTPVVSINKKFADTASFGACRRA